jgi:hypothetical protein
MKKFLIAAASYYLGGVSVMAVHCVAFNIAISGNVATEMFGWPYYAVLCLARLF